MPYPVVVILQPDALPDALVFGSLFPEYQRYLHRSPQLMTDLIACLARKLQHIPIMQFGIIGLGRTGTGTALRLMGGGHHCVAYDQDRDKVANLARQGAMGARSFADLAGNLQPPRVIWLTLPAGEPSAYAMLQLADHLRAGDITVDGSDSRYQDAILRRNRFGEHGIDHIDYTESMSDQMPGCFLMLGGRKSAVDYLDPMLSTLAPQEGQCVYCGSNGAAHFVQKVHSGIEEPAMQSFAHGFDVLYHADTFGYELPLNEIARIWRHDSLICSRLRELTEQALAREPKLATEPTLAEVQGVRARTAVTRTLYAKFRVEANRRFAEKMLLAMRLAFGGDEAGPDLDAGRERRMPAASKRN